MPYLTVIEFGTESMYIMQTTQTREMLSSRNEYRALDTRNKRGLKGVESQRETQLKVYQGVSRRRVYGRSNRIYAKEKETEKEIHYLLLPTEGGSRSLRLQIVGKICSRERQLGDKTLNYIAISRVNK